VIFSIGLFKKVVIADTVALYANPFYATVHSGDSLTLIGGWLAAATYTFQLYFDFSGYSDMAIGLARMFGIKLPLNFHSPLRARNIPDFWRRWHMTLQRFLYAYLYQPIALPLNRWAAGRDIGGWTLLWVTVGVPTIITFLLSGVWHGAGWPFIVFGAMHGVYITVYEFFRERRTRLQRKLRKLRLKLPEPGRLALFSHHVLTLICILFANVVFRALTLHDAATVWTGMVGLGGFEWSAPGLGWEVFVLILVCGFIVFLLPNTQQIMGRFDPAYNWSEWRNVAPATLAWTWRPNFLGMVYVSLLLSLGVICIQRGEAVFLYFNF
jgi:D-alanyl-lipoteichoic acid acyltransferase DltB (MBOAT superfamily)